jgi:serine/threonine protein kinase
MMTPERFRQVRNLFEAVMEKPPSDRREFLAVAAASSGDGTLQEEVARLVASHERRVTFLDGTMTAAPELRTDPSRMEGRRLGAFEILREIGRGGMGTVYLARRVDGVFEQQVAIKVVTPGTAGPEVTHRFRQEREILASLDHPNIARLYDGGSTEEDWPYFVMEYVEGQPIDEWCDGQKLNVSERIRLFRTVCAAVHSAHQHRVVHRDLKPSNILVKEDGTVKLLDFGIAKLVRDADDARTELATATGLRLMTPEYASPEQVRQEEITPLSDVYSLGVILYELLTGRRPHRLKTRMLHEIVRAVCDTEADRPSSVVLQNEERVERGGTTVSVAPGKLSAVREGSPVDLQRRLAGDLDGVLLKTLKKEPSQRYRTVGQLSDDLERHLQGQTVMASPVGAGTAIMKQASRHTTALVFGLAGLAAIATGGIQVTSKGLLWVGGGLLALGILSVLTNKKLAESLGEGGYEWAVRLGMPAAGFWFIYGREGTDPFPVLPLVVAALAIYASAKVAAWGFRDRWAGKLYLRTRADHRQIWIFGLGLLSTGMGLGNAIAFPETRIPYMLLVQIGLTIVFLLLFARQLFMNHLEIRERGILYRGGLIPWVKIESYEWEPTTYKSSPVPLYLGRQPKERLRLRTHRDRHLAIWPEA